MIVEVLISTMNLNSKRENINLIKKMGITTKSLTISQTNSKGIDFSSDNRIIYDNNIGLSQSRNLAIENSVGDIIVIADDDVIYEKDYEEKILQAYKENPNADAIAFYVESRNPERKVRKLKSKRMGLIEFFRISSFQLTFKVEKIRNIKFDENFGAGTKNYCGEETIFLHDCCKAGLKLYYKNAKIGEVEQKSSTWYYNIGKEYIQVEKACFKRMWPKFWWILFFQFIIRKGWISNFFPVLKVYTNSKKSSKSH